MIFSFLVTVMVFAVGGIFSLIIDKVIKDEPNKL